MLIEVWNEQHFSGKHRLTFCYIHPIHFFTLSILYTCIASQVFPQFHRTKYTLQKYAGIFKCVHFNIQIFAPLQTLNALLQHTSHWIFCLINSFKNFQPTSPIYFPVILCFWLHCALSVNYCKTTCFTTWAIIRLTYFAINFELAPCRNSPLLRRRRTLWSFTRWLKYSRGTNYFLA